MKTAFACLLLFLMVTKVGAQSVADTSAMNRFVARYNAKQYGAIFHWFAPDMQAALPLEKAVSFFKRLRQEGGRIRGYAFTGFQNGSYATYKTDFEKAVFTVRLSLDHQRRINGLLVTAVAAPLVASQGGSDSGRVVNGLGAYPKKIADAIYAKAKDFPDHTQLAIAVVRKGQTHYYGMIRKGDTLRPVDNQNKVFEIGSITKVFTATVLAALVVEHKLRLTDDINGYFPFAFKDSIGTSWLGLANHTAGLPRLPVNFDASNQRNPYSGYGRQALYTYLKEELKLQTAPLHSYSYSNLGVGLLGYALGLAQHTSFQQLLREKVFDRYHMRHSFTDAKGLGAQLVRGLNAAGEAVPNWDFDALFAAGGVLSTASDLAAFAKAQFDSTDRVLALTRVPTFQVSDKMKIGLGWHLLRRGEGRWWCWHNGGTGGYTSSLAVDVAGQSAVIVLSNVSAFSPAMKNIDPLCFALMAQ